MASAFWKKVFGGVVETVLEAATTNPNVADRVYKVSRLHSEVDSLIIYARDSVSVDRRAEIDRRAKLIKNLFRGVV